VGPRSSVRAAGGRLPVRSVAVTAGSGCQRPDDRPGEFACPRAVSLAGWIGCGSAGNRLTGAIPETITGTPPIASPMATSRAAMS
jgi:hypothetical protein